MHKGALSICCRVENGGKKRCSAMRNRCVMQDEHGHTIHDPRALDPREAIIAHAEAAKKNPFYTSVLYCTASYLPPHTYRLIHTASYIPPPSFLSMSCLTSLQAYAKTQPKAIYQQEESEGEWRAARCCSAALNCFSFRNQVMRCFAWSLSKNEPKAVSLALVLGFSFLCANFFRWQLFFRHLKLALGFSEVVTRRRQPRLFRAVQHCQI